MDDIALLEAAAKAAGPDIFWSDGERCFLLATGTDYIRWNPLLSDADAFRLAVKKEIFTAHHALFMIFYYEEIALDVRPSEATRRAIVRAVV